MSDTARPLTKNEAGILCRFLDAYGDRLGNDGCNDHELPDTPENRELVRASMIEAHGGKDDGEPARVYKGKIITHNWILLAHLRTLLAASCGLAEE